MAIPSATTHFALELFYWSAGLLFMFASLYAACHPACIKRLNPLRRADAVPDAVEMPETHAEEGRITLCLIPTSYPAAAIFHTHGGR